MLLRITGCWLLCWCAFSAELSAAPLELQLRSRQETEAGSGRYHTVLRRAHWKPDETAIVICDMWNDHYCRSAARRVAEMAPRMNDVIRKARQMGVLIIHCPSGCMDQYADTPQRKLAQQAPKVQTDIPLEGWCHWDQQHEAPMPVDVTYPCDDEQKLRERKRFYQRQIDTLEIADGDAVTDSAEAFYLMKQRGIGKVIIMGVHTNMCVLGRPFGIRQMVYQGQQVVLMRDMTDTMYNPRNAPYVSHFTGNDLVLEHIERHWCPTITSADILGGQPFRFAADQRKHLVIVIGEDEYDTAETLPPWALAELGKDFRISLVYADSRERNRFRGLRVLQQADVALWSIRRRTPPVRQLAMFRQYIDRGSPLVAIRTTSHAFAPRKGSVPDGLGQWPRFDREVLGGHYQNHHGNQLQTVVRTTSGEHPIFRGVPKAELRVFGSLYRSLPLAPAATPLLVGRAGQVLPPQPVAWTHRSPAGGRVFYTSLGHPDDFTLPAFRRILRNAVYWAASVPVTDAASPPAATGGSGGC